MNIKVNFNNIKYDANYVVDIDNYISLPPNQELADITNTPLDTLRQYNNWIFANGSIYYLKNKKGVFSFFNELMGEAFTKKMELPTIEYKVAVNDGEITGLLSKNFRSSELEYKQAFLLSRKELKTIRKYLMDPDYMNNIKFKKDFVTYLLNNFFISLNDRMLNTLIIVDKNFDFQIAPIFDYESAFIDSFMQTYTDSMNSYNFNPESIKYLSQNNCFFDEIYEKMMSLDIEEIFAMVEGNSGVTIPNVLKEYYSNFVDERKGYIKSLTK